MGNYCDMCSSESQLEATGETDTFVNKHTVRKSSKSSPRKQKSVDTVSRTSTSKPDHSRDYSTDIGLSLHPSNSVEMMNYHIEHDLERLQKLYPAQYQSLLPREFIKTIFYDKFEKLDDENTFTLMQFNILSDMLSGAYWPGGMEEKSKSFIGIDKQCLEWRYRGLRIVEEIVRCGADIVCLQECDRLDFLDRYLGKLGYKNFFAEKYKSPVKQVGSSLREARDKAMKIGNIEKEDSFDYSNDGCAIFYKVSKFEVLDEEQQITTQIDANVNEITALAVGLKQKSNGKRFMVVTSHLKSKKKLEGEKLRVQQAQAMFGQLGNVKDSPCAVQNPHKLPMLVCTDMNALPLNNGEYDSLCYDYLTKKLNFISMYKDAVTTELELENNVKRGERGKEPDYTTFKTRSNGTVKHTIDYIFEKSYDDSSIYGMTYTDGDDDSKDGIWSVTEYYSIPRTEKVIPDWFYPSDHFSLCVKLTWNDA